MSDLWINLLPILGVMLISPARTIAVILLLHTPRHAVTATGYVAGMISSMLVQGVLFALGFRLVGLTADDRAGDLAIVVGVLFVVAGIILIAGAFRFIFPSDDGGGDPSALFEKLEHLTPKQGFTTGFGWLMVSPKQWVFVLTAVAVIFAANLSALAGLTNYLIFTLLIQGAYLVIIVTYLAAPEGSARVLDGLFNWLKRNLRATAITIFLGFGLLFLIKGLAALAG